MNCGASFWLLDFVFSIYIDVNTGIVQLKIEYKQTLLKKNQRRIGWCIDCFDQLPSIYCNLQVFENIGSEVFLFDATVHIYVHSVKIN